jgi:uncharacterized repeat protein (TIGR01451 family)
VEEGSALRRVAVVIGVAAVLAIVLCAPAGAHEDPPGCSTGGLNPSFAVSSELGIVHRNGDHLEIAVSLRNDTAGTCTVDDATVTVQLPAPDGTPTGPLITLVTDASFPGGMAPKTLPATAPYDVALNPGVFRAPVTTSVSGIFHGPGGDVGPLTSSLTTSLVVSKPEIDLSVTPDVTSGSAPLTVTYTYTATNDSPAPPPPPPDLGPAPSLASGSADERAMIADDTCSPVEYVSGDTLVTFPALLDPTETWTFTCTHTFPVPGTFANEANIVGFSTRDGRPWPATTATSSVTALGADLVVAKTHAGDFEAGGAGVYELVVRNAGNQAASGAVAVEDRLPAGLTATAISGAGWSCTLATLRCERSDSLPAGASYPVVRVDVTAGPPAQVTNVAVASGGGEAYTGNNSAADPTSIVRRPSPPAAEIKLLRVKSNRDGTVTLKVFVSGPGAVSADDPLHRRKSAAGRRNRIKRTTSLAAAKGRLTLKLKAAGKAKRRLKEKGQAGARVQVTFTPTGGESVSASKRIRFQRAARK